MAALPEGSQAIFAILKTSKKKNSKKNSKKVEDI